MKKAEFIEHANGDYSHIPVYEEFVADLISPLYVFSNFYKQPNCFLFESAKSHEVKGRYSIMTLPSALRYDYFENELHVIQKTKRYKEKVINPYDHLDKITSSFSSPHIDSLPVFTGGLIGYFSYESFQYVEPKLKYQNSKIPLISLCESTELVVFDNFKGTFYIIVNTKDKTSKGYDLAKARINEIKTTLFSLQASIPHNIEKKNIDIPNKSNIDYKTYEEQVNTIKQFVHEGEIMQAVLSKEVTFEGSYDPMTLYRALRLINPSPYMFYLSFDDFNVIGASPEILVQQTNGKVTIRPIAGTRKRGETSNEDLTNKIDLLEDDKEKSEHMMLVDLARNDLSKVAEIGTVQVDEMMVIEKYSHVMHMTSNVIGQKKSDASAVDCLKAALPAGTLSGAPKIRAMEILSKLENRVRGIYGGAVGYIGFNGSLDTAIVIRTAIHTNKDVKVGVGGGIVFDSTPENEWQETESKLAVFREALKYS